MKVLIIPAHFYPKIGGSEKDAMLFVKGHRLRGDDVTVITGLENNADEFEIYDKIPIYRIRFQTFSMKPGRLARLMFNFVPQFYKLVKLTAAIKPDIIHISFLSENAVFAGLLTFFYKRDVVVSLHGNDQILEKMNIINFLIVQRLLNRAKKIKFISSAYKDEVLKISKYKFDSKKVEIFNIGIDLPDFDKITDKFVLPNNRRYIFSCGRFIDYKGFDTLIMAFWVIHENHPDIDLIIAGDGWERKNLLLLSRILNISTRVHLTGFVDPQNVIKYFRGCLFVVVPSISEPFGNVVLEAMAAGKAVIGSNVGGIPEIIKDGVTGYLFEPGDASALAKKIEFLIGADENCRMLSANGRKYVEDNRDWSKIYLGNLTDP